MNSERPPGGGLSGPNLRVKTYAAVIRRRRWIGAAIKTGLGNRQGCGAHVLSRKLCFKRTQVEDEKV